MTPVPDQRPDTPPRPVRAFTRASGDVFARVNLAPMFDAFGSIQSSTVMIKDREHRFVYVNQVFADLIGRDIADIEGRTDVELGLPHSLLFGDAQTGLPGVRTRDEQAMLSGECVCYMDGEVDLGRGCIGSTYTLRTPFKDENDEVVGLLIQGFDESGIRRLEQEVESAQATLSSRNGELDALDSVLADLMSCREVRPLLVKIAETVVEQTHADGVCMAVPDATGGALEAEAVTGDLSAGLVGRRWQPGHGPVGEAWSSGEPRLIDEGERLPAGLPERASEQLYALPIIGNGEVVAVLVVSASAGSGSLAGDVRTLRRIVDLSGIAIANVQMIVAGDVALKRTRKLSAISQLLGNVEDTDEAIRAVCRRLPAALDIDAAISVGLEPDGSLVLTSIGTRDAAGDAMTAVLDAPYINDCVASWCMDTARSATLVHGQTDEREGPLAAKVAALLDLGSSACVPLRRDGVPIGALLVLRKRSRAELGDAALGVLQTVANQLSFALDRQDLSRALHHQAFHDRLTGLPNRYRLEIELERVLATWRSEARTGAVLFIDLDGFKNVNDTLGHATGDRLLFAVAQRFESCLAEADVLARMGGDEFAVIVSATNDQACAIRTGTDLIDSLASPFELEGSRFRIGASVGLSRFPDDGDSTEQLLRNADTAMYQAKQSGKGHLSCYDKTLFGGAPQGSCLQSDLRDALAEGQLELHYQPQVNCLDGRVIGVEALLRWQHPHRGWISPGEFIPVAEQAGLINAIGSWVLEEAVAQLARWQSGPLAGLRVSINVAATQFSLIGFVDQVIGTLQASDVDPARLELEITESVVMNDVRAVADRLRRLRSAGLRIAIDDFGTGYSSLSCLQDLPLDALKIDRAFITRLQDERGESPLARSIAFLAASMGLETVAEGVETTLQRDAVTAMGCDLVQGFFHSRAVPPAELPDVVDRLEAGGDGDQVRQVA